MLPSPMARIQRESARGSKMDGELLQREKEKPRGLSAGLRQVQDA
jgi:hypothetical protein